MKRGKFITVEGIEGVGKSTNIDVLVQRIEAAGHKVLTTREPGGTPIAEDIRDMLNDRGDEPIPEIAEAAADVCRTIVQREQRHSARRWRPVPGWSATALPIPAGPTRAVAGASRWKPSIGWPTGFTGIPGPTSPCCWMPRSRSGMERAGKRSAPDRFEQERHDFFQRVRECYLQTRGKRAGPVCRHRHHARVSTRCKADVAALTSNS